MLKIGTILLPTDLSETSKASFGLACSLAHDYGARLIVLHVIPTGTLEVRTLAELGLGESGPEFEQSIRYLLQTTMPPSKRVPVEYRILRGDPAPTILRFAAESSADLLVVGSHGRTGLRRLLMGSVAEHLMRQAPCPVLVQRA